MAANTFDIYSMAGKDLYTKKDVPAYYDFPESKNKFVIKAGERAGKIYNYMYFKNGGVLWWVFIDNKKKKYFVKHDETSFDIKSLKAQGVKTVEEATKESEDLKLGFFESTVKKYALPVVGIGAGVYLTGVLIKSYISKPSN